MKKLLLILSVFAVLLLQGCYATIRPMGDGHGEHHEDHHDEGHHGGDDHGDRH